MEPLPRRLVVALVLIGIATLGWLFIGGWLFTILAVVGLCILTSSWIGGGGNDIYGTRTEYPRADDLVRADDGQEQEPHPGPLPPQPPGW